MIARCWRRGGLDPPRLRRLSVFSTQVCARAMHDYGCHMLTTLDLTGDASGVQVPESL